MANTITDQTLRAVGEILGARLATGESARRLHARDEGWHPEGLPDAVAYPETPEEISAILRLCAAHLVPVIPFGAGSGMEGGVNAVRGGISLDLSRLDRILKVSPEDMDCWVEAGARRLALNRHLRDTGLFFPVDPGADASLGGMAATCASGPNAARYGTMRSNVLALEVVLASGEIVRTGSRARKSAAGYDLTRLFVGSEGTLGIITKLCLRLQPIPEAARTALVQSRDIRGLLDLALALLQSGRQPAKLEFMDAAAVRAVKLYDPELHLADEPLLLIEFAGAAEAVAVEAALATQTTEELGLGTLVWAATPEERSALWKARHGVAHAEKLLRPGARALVTDVCVPVSALPACLAETRDDIAGTELLATAVGHLGDGNFHVSLLIDPENAREVEAAEALHTRLVERALRLEGTCTGEHGIGLGKLAHLKTEAGASLAVMRGLKDLLDPAGILNPGKVMELAHER